MNPRLRQPADCRIVVAVVNTVSAYRDWRRKA